MPDAIPVLPHKAAPLASDEGYCALCGQAIKRVPGARGPVCVHEYTGTVAGFPALDARRIIKGLMDELGPSPWDAEALTTLANWLGRMGFGVEESDASVEEYIAGLAQANSRNDEWRFSDRRGNRLVTGQRVSVLGPVAAAPHKGEGSVTKLIPGGPADVPLVVVTDDDGLDLTVNCVNVAICPPPEHQHDTGDYSDVQ